MNIYFKNHSCPVAEHCKAQFLIAVLSNLSSAMLATFWSLHIEPVKQKNFSNLSPCLIAVLSMPTSF